MVHFFFAVQPRARGDDRKQPCHGLLLHREEPARERERAMSSARPGPAGSTGRRQIAALTRPDSARGKNRQLLAGLVQHPNSYANFIRRDSLRLSIPWAPTVAQREGGVEWGRTSLGPLQDLTAALFVAALCRNDMVTGPSTLRTVPVRAPELQIGAACCIIENHLNRHGAVESNETLRAAQPSTTQRSLVGYEILIPGAWSLVRPDPASEARLKARRGDALR